MPSLNTPPRGGKFDPAIEDKRLRDQFAGRAMEALLVDLKFIHETAQAMRCTPADYVAITAWDIADSMIKKRNEK